MAPLIRDPFTALSAPLLPSPSTTADNTSDQTPQPNISVPYPVPLKIPTPPLPLFPKPVAVLSDHSGPVSCLSLCGEFILSASHGSDIIVWQQPHLKPFARFGRGEGSVKALVAAGNRVFTAHQDSKIRAWRVSRSSENAIRLVSTLPTTKDYLGKFMNQRNYVQTRRHHKRLWIEHHDTISCLAVSNGLIYSGSWDKSLKVWRMSDFKCLESIKAHDDAVNGLVARNGLIYSSSADGKIKVWGLEGDSEVHSLKGILEGHKDISMNSVVVTNDGRFVYGGGSDGFIMGWAGNKEFNSWRLCCEVKGHIMAVLCVCLAGGDRFLCTGSADTSVCVWRRDLVDGGLLRHAVINGHEGPVKCLQGSMTVVGGGFLVYSGSFDRSVRVWWVPNDCEGNGDPTSIRKRF